MRIGALPSSPPPPPAAPRATDPGLAASLRAPPPAAGDSTAIDRVAALVDRLAVEARASGASTGTAHAERDAQVLSLMRGVFGVGPIRDLQLDFDYEHRRESGAAAAVAIGVGASAAHASAYAIDATSFSAHGTFSDADGHQYKFTLQYSSVAAAAVDMDQATYAGSATPAGGAGGAAPRFVAGSGPATSDHGWNLSALLATVRSHVGAHGLHAHNERAARAATLVDRLWRLLGHEGSPLADAAAEADDAAA